MTEKEQIRDTFCKLSNLLQSYAADLARSIPFHFENAEHEKADDVYLRVKNVYHMSDDVLRLCVEWREREFPLDTRPETPAKVKEPAKTRKEEEKPLSVSPGRTRAPSQMPTPGTYTTREEYIQLIAKCLYEQGGVIPKERITGILRRYVAPFLTDVDKGYAQNTPYPRYYKGVGNAQRVMFERGLLEYGGHGEEKGSKVVLTLAGINLAEKVIQEGVRDDGRPETPSVPV